MAKAVYRGAYLRAREAVIGLPCVQGCGRVGTTADHYPPLSSVPPGQRWVGVLRPMCVPCMREQAGKLTPRARFKRSRTW